MNKNLDNWMTYQGNYFSIQQDNAEMYSLYRSFSEHNYIAQTRQKSDLAALKFDYF